VTLRSRHLTDDSALRLVFHRPLRRAGRSDGRPITSPIAGPAATATPSWRSSSTCCADSADTEADAIFTADRLQAQQRQIARRIDHGRPRRTRHQLPSSVQRADDHGVELAQSASLDRRRGRGRLVVGVALGASYKSDWRSESRGDAIAARSRTAVQANARTRQRSRRSPRAAAFHPTSAADDAFLFRPRDVARIGPARASFRRSTRSHRTWREVRDLR